MNESSRMEKFSHGIIRHRWLILILMLAVTGGFLYLTKNLVISNDYETWLPENDKVTELYREVDRTFSSNTVVFVVLDFSEKGVFHPESLEFVKKMTLEMEGLDEIFNVISLTNIIDIRKAEGGIEVGDLVDEIPRTEEEMEALKEYVLGKELYVNSVVDANAKYTVVVTYIDTTFDEVKVAEVVLETVEEIIGDHPYYFGGDPALTLYIDRYMNEDMALLVSMMFGVMFIVLFFGLRRILGMVLPISLVILCILWTFGMKAVLKYPVNIFSPAVVVLLIAIGSDYAVHIYNHFLRRRDIGLSTSEITLPVLMSAVTTIAGLLTFATTRIAVLKYFGVELAIGLAAACILSVILLPILIYLFRAKPGPVVTSEEDHQHVFSRMLISFGQWSFDHTKTVIFIVCLLLVLAGLGIPRLSTNVDYVDLLPEECPPRVGNDILEDHFTGIYPHSMYFKGDIEDPAIMAQKHYFENFLRSERMLAGFTSVNDFIAEENWLLNDIYAIPETREGVANLWFLLEGDDILRTIVTDDRDRSQVVSMIKKPETGLMREISYNVNDFIDENVSREVVTLDPKRLSETDQKVLKEFQIEQAAHQLSWLAAGYDKQNDHDFDPIRSRLSEAFPEVDENLDFEPVWQKIGRYLEEETVEVLSRELIEGLLAYTKEGWQQRRSPEFQRELEKKIMASGIMDAEDSEMTASGMLKRAEFSFRLQRVAALRELLQGQFSQELQQDKDFIKRSEGVLWELWAEQPAFFLKQVSAIPGIEKAVVNTSEAQIGQAGTPEIFTRFDDLLLQSQVQSLFLASIIVFVLVSLTQLSVRRGFVSLLSVLVPLEIILGLMGWVGIPLDFGSVLCGALIVGLGVDGSIHFLHYYHHLREEGLEREQALRGTMGHVGRAIITANITTCLGFLVLSFSNTTALKSFSFANALAIFLVTLSVLSFLPVLIIIFGVGKDKDTSSQKA